MRVGKTDWQQQRLCYFYLDLKTEITIFQWPSDVAHQWFQTILFDAPPQLIKYLSSTFNMYSILLAAISIRDFSSTVFVQLFWRNEKVFKCLLILFFLQTTFSRVYCPKIQRKTENLKSTLNLSQPFPSFQLIQFHLYSSKSQPPLPRGALYCK